MIGSASLWRFQDRDYTFICKVFAVKIVDVSPFGIVLDVGSSCHVGFRGCEKKLAKSRALVVRRKASWIDGKSAPSHTFCLQCKHLFGTFLAVYRAYFEVSEKRVEKRYSSGIRL